MKTFFFRKACLALLVACIIFSGCNKDEDNSVEEKLVGKWELQSITMDGVKYDFPDTEKTIGYGTGGYEFGTSTFKFYLDEVIFQEYSEVFTKGNKMYVEKDKVANFTWEVSGDVLTLSESLLGISFIQVCKKVSKFSWED